MNVKDVWKVQTDGHSRFGIQTEYKIPEFIILDNEVNAYFTCITYIIYQTSLSEVNYIRVKVYGLNN